HGATPYGHGATPDGHSATTDEHGATPDGHSDFWSTDRYENAEHTFWPTYGDLEIRD
ncbi:MAG: hypothetical protein HW404_2372, partial [Anaerolineales bacterium]|nr:hypothetical protein [Anaerolineales bacterium]